MEALSCACLNVQIRVTKRDASTPVSLRDLPDCKLVTAQLDERSTRSTLPSLLQMCRTPDGAAVARCLLCDTVLYVLCDSRLLVNADLMSISQMDKARHQAHFSPSLGLLLPPVQHKTPLHVDTKDSSCSMDSSPPLSSMFGDQVANSAAAHEIQSACDRYLRAEQHSMNTRIEKFIEEQHQQFERLRLRARDERNRLLSHLQQQQADDDQFSLVRQRSGEDSAVPASPVSLQSAGHSPAIPASHNMPKWPAPDSPHAASSPMTVTSARSRSSTGAMPSLPSHPEEASKLDDELFSLDEDAMPAEAFVPDDDDEQTDGQFDSGTGEEFMEYQRRRRVHAPGAGLLVSKFGTSLPVSIPGRFWPPDDAKDSNPGSSDEESEPKMQVLPTRRAPDVAEGMRALARSIQAADDPERLFGERPARRRYKTGDVVRIRAATLNKC